MGRPWVWEAGQCSRALGRPVCQRPAPYHSRLATHRDVADVRGAGLLLAIECRSGAIALRACTRALQTGVIAIPSGERGDVIAVTPPLTIEREILELAFDRLADALA